MAQPDNNTQLSSTFKTFFERETLTGVNFNDWYRSLRIVLRVADTYDYLYKPCPDQPLETTYEGDKTAWKAEYEKHNDVACLMLGKMSSTLQKQFESYPPQLMLAELKKMFEKPQAVEIYDLVDALHSCKQAPGKSVSAHVLEMKGYIDQLHALGKSYDNDMAINLINRDLKRKGNCLMVNNIYKWVMDYALESAVHILNMVPTKKVNKTPYEMRHGKAPNLSYLKVWGYEAYVKRSIMYAIRYTRPDVAFAQKLVSRYQQNPGKLYWVAVKHILKYLRNTRDMFLVYGGKPDTELDVATQAEYVAALEAAIEAVWIRNFFGDLGVMPSINKPINMYCDNSAAIIFANEHEIMKGARHFLRRHHYVREQVKTGEIKLIKVHTDGNFADPFTKALPRGMVVDHANGIGL
nr:hypothetical protein [Tanacetum cinerariifolium]